MRKAVSIFIIALITFACEKDYTPFIENGGIPLLSKIMVDGELFYEYSYNEANLVTEEKHQHHYTRHYYNNSKQLVRSDYYVDPDMFSSTMPAMKREEWVNPWNTEKSLTTTFDYDSGGQLIRKTYDRPSVSHSEFSEYTWENNRISRRRLYWNNELSGYIEYEYDNNGNLVNEEKYMLGQDGNTTVWTSTEYEFDNMNNPYQSFEHLMSPGKYMNRNNILKEKYTVHIDTGIDDVSVIEYSYEYDMKGYPVMVNGNIEYIYK
ncbi:MAG: hypothetical protein ACQERS_02060 [Bacteroidota bacterium]